MAIPGILIGRLLGLGIMTTSEISAARIAAGIVAEAGKAEEAISKLGDDTPENIAITIPVSSTAIRSIGWDPAGAIIVEFMARGTYTYDGSYQLFMAFMAASSKGQFFNEHFRK